DRGEHEYATDETAHRYPSHRSAYRKPVRVYQEFRNYQPLEPARAVNSPQTCSPSAHRALGPNGRFPASKQRAETRLLTRAPPVAPPPTPLTVAGRHLFARSEDTARATAGVRLRTRSRAQGSGSSRPPKSAPARLARTRKAGQSAPPLRRFQPCVAGSRTLPHRPESRRRPPAARWRPRGPSRGARSTT